MCKFDEKFRKFYEKNFHKVNDKFVYKFVAFSGEKTLHNIDNFIPLLDNSIYFITTLRAADHGVDTSGVSYDWNINHIDCRNKFSYSWNTFNKTYITNWGYIKFGSKNERDNLTEFWYRNGKNGLMHKLIKGLNKSNGSIAIAIPRVDWSHPWTDEEILKEYGYTEEEIKEILK